jgi:glycosyltransferase involved in cell wall biosynthesis
MRNVQKLLFYLPGLSNGGAERVQAVLADGFARRGCSVLVVVDREAHESRHLLDPSIRVVTLGGGHARDIFALRRVIQQERPDAIVSALAYCNLKATLAAAGAGAANRLILTYHGYAVSEPQRLSALAYRLAPLISRVAAATVAVSDGLKLDLLETFRTARTRTLRIYNPVKVSGVPAPLDAETLAARAPLVLAVGRLLPEKGFLTLLRAFAQTKTPDARLIILGEGPQRPDLESEIARLGLQSRVDLPGHVVEPWTIFAEARCFVSASQMESFGLVLVEALAHGLPVVSTECGATAEVLENGRYGRLAPVGAEGDLARAIDASLADPGDPAPRTQRAACFSTEIALDAYQDLINRVIARASASPVPA